MSPSTLPVNDSKSGQLHLGSSLNGGEMTAGLLAKMAMEHRQVLGVFARTESFSLQDLANGLDGESLYHQFHVNSTGFLATDAAQTVADQARSGNIGLKGDRVVRSTIEFLLVSREHLDTSSDGPDYSSYSHVGTRIAPCLRRLDGSPMTSQEARNFLQQYSSAIEAHRKALEQGIFESKHSNVALPPQRSVKADFQTLSGPGETSWLEILGGVDLVGLHSEDSGVNGNAELRVRANSPLMFPSNTNGKRGLEGNDRLIVHPLIVRNLESMRGTIHARFFGGQRWAGKSKRSAAPGVSWDGDMYRVQLRKKYFRNETSPTGTSLCGDDNYIGDQIKNPKNYHEFLGEAVDPVVRKLNYSMTELDNVEDWESGGIAPFVHYLMEQFVSYDQIRRTVDLQSRQSDFEKKLFERLKNSLVAKAWADEGCFVKCEANNPQRQYKRKLIYDLDGDSCRPVCYGRAQLRAEGLYGLDETKNLGAERPPWNLNKTNIVKLSHDAYIKHGAGSLLPGSINLNPYDVVYEDAIAPLPVCRSELITVSSSNEYHKGAATYPCTCGDMYGNETLAFMQAAPWPWIMRGQKEESRALQSCLKDERLRPLADTHLAAYLNNMCQLVFGALAPPGTGSFMELKNKGSYRENQHMRKYVPKFVDDKKHLGEVAFSNIG